MQKQGFRESGDLVLSVKTKEEIMYIYQNGKHAKVTTPNADEKDHAHSSILAGNVNWYRLSGKESVYMYFKKQNH